MKIHTAAMPTAGSARRSEMYQSTRAGVVQVRVYYRCNGADGQRFGGQRLCGNRSVRAEALEAAVWQDVCALLEHPEKIAEEYRRRQEVPAAERPGVAALARQVQQVQRGLARLIDAYAEGLLDKSEFEPRLHQAKAKLARLQAEVAEQEARQAEAEELRLVIGGVRDFAARVQEGLATAEWGTRREIIRTLVKCVEVDDAQVRIVYRISPVPFAESPSGGFLQDCLWREGGQGCQTVHTFSLPPFSTSCATQCRSRTELSLPQALGGGDGEKLAQTGSKCAQNWSR